MASLPDGGTVSSQFFEDWEDPVVILTTPDFNSISEVTAGEKFDVLVSVVDDDGNPIEGFDVSIDLVDSSDTVRDTIGAQTDSNGEATATFTAPKVSAKTEFRVRSVFGVISVQGSEDWETLDVSFNSKFGPEGWES